MAKIGTGAAEGKRTAYINANVPMEPRVWRCLKTTRSWSRDGASLMSHP